MTRTKAIIIGVLALTLLASGLVVLAGGGFGRESGADRPMDGPVSMFKTRTGTGSPTPTIPTGPVPLTGPVTDTTMEAVTGMGIVTAMGVEPAKGCTAARGRTRQHHVAVLASSRN